MLLKTHLAGAAVGLALAVTFGATAASADAIPYGNVFTENPVTYSFTATTTGDVTAYFFGTGASFDEQLGLLINGVDSGVVGLDNQTSNFGDTLNFAVTAGDSLTFYINVGDFSVPANFTYYSDKSLNSDGVNHVYSTAYSGGGGIPAGIYVGFEDLSPAHDSSVDYNYTDEQFVFTNTSAVSSGAPEPGAWALMLMGFGGLGAMLRRRRGAPLTA